MCNFFFFMKGSAIPLSNVVALIARYPLSRPGTIIIWQKYRDKIDKLLTRRLANKADSRGGDFRDLIDRIYKVNPEIQIDAELLK